MPSRGPWVPYNEDQLQADFTSLLKTNFLDNLWIQVIDEPFDNGVVGKHVVFHMEERPKLKGIEYTGSKIVEISKIDEELKKKGIELRLDSFVDQVDHHARQERRQGHVRRRRAINSPTSSRR